ncbi:hypothetical protein OIY81_1243 [Cryptosporidium canis]|uniref:DNA-directed primase/polymerase protein n=1 Tax=Cryptosporidium canis TaxID=195482 RepID=A0ABQ8P6X7_9CRYT|nr:hypothetical protein OJ252_2077 [Cryptosporidium canis]KAJ1612644.1 hypothetical protein OIY81_1243 [Cryptosporidium canis]
MSLDQAYSCFPCVNLTLKQLNESTSEINDYIYHELLINKYINPCSDKLEFGKIFKRFFSQEKAIEYYFSINSHFGQLENIYDCRILPLGIFAEESASSGSRSYIVSSYESIWHYISSLCDYQRHIYEVILLDQPCWLYFDIEYNRNKYHLNDQNILKDFTKHLIKWIYSAFGCLIEKNDIIYLCSSNIDKFSYHIIVKKIDTNKRFSTLFKNNLYMKSFIRLFISYLDESNILISKLDNFKLQSIIDTGVYTKNRCFRMLYSSKYGKNSIFQVDEENTDFVLTDIPPIKLFRSMITFLNIRNTLKSSFISKKYITEQLCLDLDKFGLQEIQCIHEPSFFLHQVKEENKYIPKHLVKVIEYVVLFWNKLSEELGNHTRHILCNLDENKLADFCMKKISLDFVEQPSIKIKTYIGTVSYFKESEIITISLTKLNKLCFNVEREHISNGIKLVVDFNKKRFYQKCFDPDCIHFKSRSFVIPKSLIDYSFDILELYEMIEV